IAISGTHIVRARTARTASSIIRPAGRPARAARRAAARAARETPPRTPETAAGRRRAAARPRPAPCAPRPRHGALRPRPPAGSPARSEEHTSELQSRFDLVCRLLLEKKKKFKFNTNVHRLLY